jgi:hypothetical protein
MVSKSINVRLSIYPIEREVSDAVHDFILNGTFSSFNKFVGNAITTTCIYEER